MSSLLVRAVAPRRQKWRARRAAPLLAMIEAVHRQKGTVRIVDLGGTREYWRILPEEFFEAHDVHVTLVNLSTKGRQDEPRFRFVEGDACSLPQFEANSFDIVHSNSVIEHVGGWQRMKAFASEVHRLARRHWIQTPNFWFPVEPHNMTPFFHWLPRPVRYWLVLRFALGNWGRCRSYDEACQAVDSNMILNRRMMRALFPDSTHLTERLALLPKSLIACKD